MSELLAESFRELLLALANPAAVNDNVTGRIEIDGVTYELK
jgi:hypothetical protein